MIWVKHFFQKYQGVLIVGRLGFSKKANKKTFNFTPYVKVLFSITDSLHEHKVGSALKLQYSISEAAASYIINATLVVCTGTEYACQDLNILNDQELKKPDCSASTRRRRQSATG